MHILIVYLNNQGIIEKFIIIIMHMHIQLFGQFTTL